MQLVIDALDSVSGWTPTGTVTVHGTNTIPSHIAANQSASLIFKFPTGSTGQSVTKTLTPVDVTNYDTLVFHLWSRDRALREYREVADCSYKLSFGGAEEFFIRTWSGFSIERIDISGITSISEIKFEATHNAEDYLLVSYMVARADEVPVDIFRTLKTEIERIRDELHPNGLEIGNLTATAGATDLTLDNDVGYLWRYATLKFSGGGNTETHQVKDINEGAGTFDLMSTFDGATLLNTFTAATVYLQFPVEIYQLENEIRVPGMALYGMEPERIERGNDEDLYTFAYTATGFSQDREGKGMRWPVHIAIASRHLELNATMSRIIRVTLGRLQGLWINGEKFSIDFTDTPVESLPSEPFDVLPSLEYTVNVEFKEVVWPRETPILSDTATITVLPVTSL